MDHHTTLRTSWDRNADAWTTAVRDGAIASRRLGTDAAVVAACTRALAGRRAPRVLDAGCGEGWLARALATYEGAQVTGIDASEALVARARAADDAVRHDVRYEAVSFETLRADAGCVAGPFDLAVCNFALLDDAAAETLRALAARLAPDGRLVIQTLHPWTVDGPYRDGWRTETFAGFDTPFPAAMPWFFRTLASWVDAVAAAGLRVASLEEPPHPETARPLSLLLTCAAA